MNLYRIVFLWKLDVMSLDSWHESRRIFMKTHRKKIMSVYRIDPSACYIDNDLGTKTIPEKINNFIYQ